MKEFFFDTCVLPRSCLEAANLYRQHFGAELGIELLPMFDLPGFEENLRQNIPLLAEGPLMFHEPVWGVEHTSPKGSPGWEESMVHLRLTQKYAAILHPVQMVFHFNNCPVPPGKKDRMLTTALENLDEMRDWFPDVRILAENTGIRAEGTQLLDQAEFTDLCRQRRIPVQIDVGHANANGWDIPKLVRDLQDLIGGFHLHNNDGVHDLHNRLREGTLDPEQLIPLIDRLVPDVPRVIEYTQPTYHGVPLLEDIAYLRHLSRENAEKGGLV